MKVAPDSRAVGRGHVGKCHGLIPPHGDNTPSKGVAPNRSGRTGHNTLHNGVGSPDSDDCVLSVQTLNVFFAIGKCPKQVNSSKDQDDQYQSRSFESARDNHPDTGKTPSMAILMTQSILRMKCHRQLPRQQRYFGKNPYQIPVFNIKWNWVKFLQIANFYNLKEQRLKSGQFSH